MGLKSHPARFPPKLPEFFIKYLTDKNDLVVDIFGGSNTTGFVAEQLKRKWISVDLDPSYSAMSAFRFLPKSLSEKDLLNVYYSILAGNEINIMDFLINGREVPTITKKFVFSEKDSLEQVARLKKSDKSRLKVLERAISVFS